MIKRIITFAVCLAVCLSCIAIGVMNSKANDSSAVDTANGAINGVGEGTIDTISTDGATTSLLLDKGNGLYELDGDITVTKANAANHATYKALKTLLEGKANGATAVVLDGKGKTITTEISLFKEVANLTVKNLNVVGDEIVVTNDDLYKASDSDSYTYGVIACHVGKAINIDNVTVDVDITYTGDMANQHIEVGGFFGRAAIATISNCTNNGNITVAPTNVAKIALGGFWGFNTGAGVAIDATNCINNGNLTATKNGNTSADLWLGGIGGCTFNVGDKFTNMMNTGSIKGIQNKHANSFVGGILGFIKTVDIIDSINLGNVSLEVADATTFTGVAKHRASGIVASGAQSGKVSYITGCINAGEVSVKANTTASIASGIYAWYHSFACFVTDCVNIGNVKVIEGAGSLNVAGGLSPHNNPNQTALLNSYTIASPGGEFNQNINKTGTNPAHCDAYFITVPEIVKTFTANVKAKQVNNAKALIAVVLAAAEYDSNYPHNNDDGMFIDLADLFTVTATGDSTFEANVAEDFYNDVAAIAGNVEFGAIITVQKYVNKIGDFTHDAFDAYLAANKATNAKLANIGVLYMTTGTMTLEADDFANGVNIALKNAYDITYAARAFIKVGNGVYVYSK